MSVYRHPDTPHLFCPRIAEKHGIVLAVVEYATRELCRGQDPVTCEEINVPFDISDVIERCSYLSAQQVKDAIAEMNTLGMCEVTK